MPLGFLGLGRKIETRAVLGGHGLHHSSNTSPGSGGTLGKARRRVARHGVRVGLKTGPEFIGQPWSPIGPILLSSLLSEQPYPAPQKKTPRMMRGEVVCGKQRFSCGGARASPPTPARPAASATRQVRERKLRCRRCRRRSSPLRLRVARC